MYVSASSSPFNCTWLASYLHSSTVYNRFKMSKLIILITLSWTIIRSNMEPRWNKHNRHRYSNGNILRMNQIVLRQTHKDCVFDSLDIPIYQKWELEDLKIMYSNFAVCYSIRICFYCCSKWRFECLCECVCMYFTHNLVTVLYIFRERERRPHPLSFYCLRMQVATAHWRR